MRGRAAVVHGVASPEASVVVNSQVVRVAQSGRFQTEVTLSSGVNTIEVTATDPSGRRETLAVTVTSLALPPQPFFLLVTEPQDQSIVSSSEVRVSGRTVPDAVVTVDGVSVSVDELGKFFTTVTLEEGPDLIEVVASGADGVVTSTIIPVIYRP